MDNKELGMLRPYEYELDWNVTPQEFIEFIYPDAYPGAPEIPWIGKMVASSKTSTGTALHTVNPFDLDEHGEQFALFVKEYSRYLRSPERSPALKWLFTPVLFDIEGERDPHFDALRRTTANITSAIAIVLDDIGTKINKDIPGDPNFITRTSKGNYQYVYALERTEDLETYNAVMRWLCDNGYTDAAAGDAAVQPYRLPGGRPKNDESESPATAFVDANPWTIEEFIATFGISSGELEDARKKVASNRRSSGKSQAPGAALRNPVLSDIEDPVLDWLRANGHVIEEKDDGMVLIQCPNFADHSEGTGIDAAYWPLGVGMGDTQFLRRFNCFHGSCKEKAFNTKKFLEWVEENGGPVAGVYDPVPYLTKRFAVCGAGEQLVDVAHVRKYGANGLFAYTKGQFDIMYPKPVLADGFDKPVSQWKAVVTNDDTMRVASLVTNPREPDSTFVYDSGQTCLNIYHRPRHPEVDGTPDILLEHIRYIMGSSAELFLDWLACKLQSPEKRPFMFVHANENFGTGRSTLMDVIRDLWCNQTANVPFDTFTGQGKSAQFNDWEQGSMIVMVEEAKVSGDGGFNTYAAYEAIKAQIDPRPSEVHINVKYGAKTRDTRWYSVFMATNHRDALKIPAHDRRVYVHTDDTERREPEYYNRLLHAIRNTDEVAKLFHFLMARDVAKFDHVNPPMTAGKAEMAALSRSTWDEVMEAVEDAELPGLMTLKQIRLAVDDAVDEIGCNETIQLQSREKIARRIWSQKYVSLHPDQPKGLRVLTKRAGHSQSKVEIRARSTAKELIDEITSLHVSERIEFARDFKGCLIYGESCG